MTIMKKKRLGRGLGSLIGNLQEINEASGSTQADGMAELDIDRIQRGRYQPRQVFEQQALLGERIEKGAGCSRVTVAAEVIRTERVDTDQHHIAIVTRSRKGYRRRLARRGSEPGNCQ